MRILIVEDDFASRRMMQKLLQPFGDVDVVVDGIEAVKACKIAWEESKPYQVVFLDIMMPNMDGHEALKEIRSYEKLLGVKSSEEVKVVMTTALEDPKNVFEAYFQGGATSYIIKPIDTEKIKREMEKILGA